MMTPGLTALHEAIALGQLPLALPEQHYGHVVNVRELQGSLFGQLATSLHAGDRPYPLVEDDFAGTRCIVEQAAHLLRDDVDYRAFRATMNLHIEPVLAVGPAERAQGIDDLSALLDGPSVEVVLNQITDEVHARMPAYAVQAV